jgi:DNA topoisomerase-3
MGKALIIAEKPSVAADIAKAIGGVAKDKSGEFFEGEQYVISSAVGHLLELAVPEEHDIKRGKWTFAALPHIPPQFTLRPIEKSESRLKILVKLIKRKDVDALINACDAGREGELIFRRIVDFTKAKQPIQRLWLQSMTPAAIRDGFARLRSDDSMQPLASAAVCRSEADWLVGINGTRAMTAFNSKSGGFYKTTVGRVQTPTLAIVVEREAKIRAFKPRDYWEIIGTFGAKAGDYTGRWFDEKFGKPEGKDADPDLKPERLWDSAKAEAIKAKCLGKPGIVTEESRPTTQSAPMLYDLTTLQREANSRFGFSAKNTLGLAQALYEKHKVLTYPRTDSRHLPEDYLDTVKKTLDSLRDVTGYGGFAEKVLANDWVRPNRRIFDDAKVSDHFAIIPTGVAPKHLSEPEQKLFDMVTRRFLAVFYPVAEHLETVRITRVEGEPFRSTGRVLVKPGWLEVYGKDVQGGDETPTLAAVEQGEKVATRDIEVKGSQTKPPARFTEATLLGAMEGAGKLIDDDELREAMNERGLGTPATRAAIIEGLIYEAYLHRNGRELVATAKAFSLMQLLDGLGVNELTRPEMTGDWEYQLKKMERGQLVRDQFMGEIRHFTEEIVRKAKLYDKDTIPGDFGVLRTRCPKCGGEVHERYREFKCLNCDFSVRRTMGGRMFEEEEMEVLLREKSIGPLQGFRSAKGFPFAAVVRLNEQNEVKFDFGNEPKEGEAAEAVDFTGREPLGTCPKCGSRVFDNGMNYTCEKAVGAGRTCDFKIGAVILQQQLEHPQIVKLLAEGKTELLRNFVSKKTNRKFEAFLVLKEGKVGFEFAPRERKFPARAKKSDEPVEKIDFTGQEPLGRCPKCGGQVFEGPVNYVCERSQAETKRCTFKSGRVVLQQPVDREQIKKLLAAGKTDVLEKFISKAGKPFAACLKLGPRGKVEFEFPER